MKIQRRLKTEASYGRPFDPHTRVAATSIMTVAADAALALTTLCDGYCPRLTPSRQVP